MAYFDRERIKQFFFIVTILLLGGLLFFELKTFIPAFLGALTLYVIMRPAILHFIYKKKWPKWLVALLLIIISIIVLFVPVGFIGNMMTEKVTAIMRHSGGLVDGAKEVVNKIKMTTNVDLLSDKTLDKAQQSITSILPKILGSTFGVVTTIVMMYFVLYFMIVDALKVEKGLYEYMPLKDRNIRRISDEVRGMVISNAVVIPLIAVIQGAFSILGYWIFGVGTFVFWGIITGITGIIPIVGTAVIWVPIAIYHITTGRVASGIGIALYCLIVVGSVDNIFRFTWQKKFANVHPLITVFGVIIGVNLFGFVGLIFGPLLLSMFLLLLRIYKDEFDLKRRRIREEDIIDM